MATTICIALRIIYLLIKMF